MKLYLCQCDAFGQQWLQFSAGCHAHDLDVHAVGGREQVEEGDEAFFGTAHAEGINDEEKFHSLDS